MLQFASPWRRMSVRAYKSEFIFSDQQMALFVKKTTTTKKQQQHGAELHDVSGGVCHVSTEH